MKRIRLSPVQKARRDVRIAEAKLRIAKRVLRESEVEDEDEDADDESEDEDDDEELEESRRVRRNFGEARRPLSRRRRF